MREAVTSIKGNARPLLLTEPIFAILITMYSGYMTLYMLEFGVSKAQVGMITSLGLSVQLVFALVSAYLTDKMGRRYSTMVFDTISWVGALIIWALAQNIWYFIAGAIVNGFSRVVMNSYYCLILEDSPPESRIHIFNFLLAAGIIAGFFSPVGAFLVSKMTLVPAMRAMIFFSAAVFMALLIIRNFFLTETETGRQKMREMKGVSLWGVFKSYLPVLRRVMANRLLVIALLVRSLYFIQLTIRGTFLSVLVTERLGFPAEAMAVFYTFNSVVMLITLLFVTPVLARYTRRWPISMGLWIHILAALTLLLSPPTGNYLLLIAAAILIALGASIASPRIDTLVANAIENDDRSVANAITNVILLLLTAPFGVIGGVLAGIDVRLPFLLIVAIFLICQALFRVADQMEKKMELR